MARKKPRIEPGQPEDFGQLDDEPIELVILTVRGSGLIDRRPGEEEPIVLTIEVSTKPHIIKRLNGRLVREIPCSIERLAEPDGDLAVDVERFIRDAEEKRTGQPHLPEPGDEEPPEDPAP
jgi:hypothetical protein